LPFAGTDETWRRENLRREFPSNRGYNAPARRANVLIRGAFVMIELEERGVVTLLRMARGKGNALNIEFLTALVETLDRIERSPARAVVITGQGSVFGAGVDLSALLAGGPPYIRHFTPLMTRAFERLATFPKPIVAAVNGHAIAGGAIIMLACDARLLARSTGRIGLSEIQVGVLFPAWALEIARFATPPEHFPTLICTGRTWMPDEALARGLVDELVDADRLLDRACACAEEMGAFPPDKFTATKLAVRRPMIESARLQAALTDESITEDWCSSETLSNVAAFVERNLKRK
jgi:enoyl-CoA hydratase